MSVWRQPVVTTCIRLTEGHPNMAGCLESANEAIVLFRTPNARRLRQTIIIEFDSARSSGARGSEGVYFECLESE